MLFQKLFEWFYGDVGLYVLVGLVGVYGVFWDIADGL